ncbi:MAG: YkgJ family cysteine cluster protein [Desulfobacterales bacterium]
MPDRLPPPLAADLEGLYAAMDADYAAAAAAGGFVCRGCADTCCRSRFEHRTWAEYLYLRRAFEALPADRIAALRARAREVIEARRRAPDAAPACPLLEGDRCLLYAARPMLCRLHGVPHRFRLPDGTWREGPGCAAFHRRQPGPGRALLDRTPHYARLARLEAACRRALGIRRGFRRTIAAMIAADPAEEA